MNSNDEVRALTKAIAFIENGGEPDLSNLRAGKTGEMKSLFQFTPATWKAYTNEIYGKEMPMDSESEIHVAASKVGKWLSQGYKPEQILSMWNAGSGEPNAWDGTFDKNTGSHKAGDSSKGVNAKYNIPFDVPGYVKKGMAQYNQYLQGGSQQENPQQGVTQPQSGQTTTQTPEVLRAISTLRSIVNKYSKPQGQPAVSQNPANGLMGGLIQQGQQPTLPPSA